MMPLPARVKVEVVVLGVPARFALDFWGNSLT